MCIQLGLVEITAGFETVVPDIVGFQFASQTFGDRFADFFQFGSGQKFIEQFFNILQSYFHIVVEFTVDIGITCVFVNVLHGLKIVQHLLITDSRFGSRFYFLVLLLYHVCIWIPFIRP